MAEVHANPKQLLRYTSKYSNAPRRISTFVQEQGHHVKALLRAHMRRRGHVQVTCLLEYQKGPAAILTPGKERLWETLTLFSR